MTSGKECLCNCNGRTRFSGAQSVVEKQSSVGGFRKQIILYNLLMLQELTTVPGHVALSLAEVLLRICEIQWVYNLIFVFEEDSYN
jgi:hypothetical protein